MANFTTPNATEMQDIESIFGWVNNTATGGFFFPVILLTLWMMGFVGVIANGRPVYRAWIFANFVCLVLSGILGLLGWVGTTYIYFFLVMLALGMVWARLQKTKIV